MSGEHKTTTAAFSPSDNNTSPKIPRGETHTPPPGPPRLFHTPSSANRHRLSPDDAESKCRDRLPLPPFATTGSGRKIQFVANEDDERFQKLVHRLQKTHQRRTDQRLQKRARAHHHKHTQIRPFPPSPRYQSIGINTHSDEEPNTELRRDASHVAHQTEEQFEMGRALILKYIAKRRAHEGVRLRSRIIGRRVDHRKDLIIQDISWWDLYGASGFALLFASFGIWTSPLYMLVEISMNQAIIDENNCAANFQDGAGYVYSNTNFQSWLDSQVAAGVSVSSYNTTMQNCVSYKSQAGGDFYTCPTFQDTTGALTSYGNFLVSCENGMMLVDRRTAWVPSLIAVFSMILLAWIVFLFRHICCWRSIARHVYVEAHLDIERQKTFAKIWQDLTDQNRSRRRVDTEFHEADLEARQVRRGYSGVWKKAAHKIAINAYVSRNQPLKHALQQLEGSNDASCWDRACRHRRICYRSYSRCCFLSASSSSQSWWLVKTVLQEIFEVGIQTYTAFNPSNYMIRNGFRLWVIVLNCLVSPVLLSMRKYELAVAFDIVCDVTYTVVGIASFLAYFYESTDAGQVTEAIAANDSDISITIVAMVWPYIVLLDTVPAAFKKTLFRRLQRLDDNTRSDEGGAGKMDSHAAYGGAKISRALSEEELMEHNEPLETQITEEDLEKADADIIPKDGGKPSPWDHWRAIWPWIYAAGSWAFGIWLLVMFFQQPTCATTLRVCEYSSCTPKKTVPLSDGSGSISLFDGAATNSVWRGVAEAQWQSLDSSSTLVSMMAAEIQFNLEDSAIDKSSELSAVVKLDAMTSTNQTASCQPAESCVFTAKLKCSSSTARLNFESRRYQSDEYMYLNDTFYAFEVDTVVSGDCEYHRQPVVWRSRHSALLSRAHLTIS